MTPKTSNSRLLPIAAGLLALLSLHSAAAATENLEYRFTGTVEGTDESLPFRSPMVISPTPRAEIGDHVTGTIHFDNPSPFALPSSRPGVAAFSTDGTEGNRIYLEVEMNGQKLTPSASVIAGVVNDATQRGFAVSGSQTVILPDGNPLVKGPADAFILSIAQGGTFVDGVLEWGQPIAWFVFDGF